MSTIQQNLQDARQQIAVAAQHCARDPKTITLIAVSKTKPVSAIEEAIAAGQYAFGENYVQEGAAKIGYFAQQSLPYPLEWHFIGPLQSNKSRVVAEHFDWCHSVNSLRLAQRLNDQRPATLSPLNVLVQINISDEASKSGITLSELTSLASQIAQMPRLVLRGLMAIPAPGEDAEQQRAIFAAMYQAFGQLRQRYASVDTLSMGMSDDMVLAIAAGTTMVRIGTAIFGARDDAAVV